MTSEFHSLSDAPIVPIEFTRFREDVLSHYSPYRHLREIDKKLVFEHTVRNRILNYGIAKNSNISVISVSNHQHFFLSRFLEWDSDFNKIPTWRLDYVLFNHGDISLLEKAVHQFVEGFWENGDQYCFFELPSEDVLLTQALGLNGFRLIETRINQYFEKPKLYKSPRYKVRRAEEADIPVLSEIAERNRNVFDRLHADAFFNARLGDKYLATFAANAVKGFSDIVLVPDEPGVPPKAFLAANFLPRDSDLLASKISRLALAVVDPSCKGWFSKLTSEFIHLSAEKDIEYVMTTTQSSNMGSLKSVEKLGFKLGSVDHVFAIRKPLERQ